MTRRRWMELAGALPACGFGQARRQFKFSICNETFQSPRFEEQCRMARQIGYEGIEIMPGTLSEDPVSIPSARRAEVRRILDDHGLAFVGLHNLLTVPKGLQATTNDTALRQRTWDFMRRLIDLCADIGPNTIMVFGSGKQREAQPGITVADALGRFRDGLASVAPHAQERHVTILIEPLAPYLCNLVNRLEECVRLVHDIDSPAVRTMFDVHNTAGENLSGPKLIRRYLPLIRHVHLNEMDGRRPGTGTYNFGALFQALSAGGYTGWCSLEVFNFEPGGEAVARESLMYLRSCIS